MSLSSLIRKDGLLKNMTMTVATKAAKELTSTSAGSVAKVATVAVTIPRETTVTDESLTRFVRQCCIDLPVTAQEVISTLLCVEDEIDIINGDVPISTMRLHIEVWINDGMPHISGKPLIKEKDHD